MNDSIQALRRQIEAEPDDDASRLALARGLVQQGRSAEAFSYLKALRGRAGAPAELTALRYRLAEELGGRRPAAKTRTGVSRDDLPSEGEIEAAPPIPAAFARVQERLDDPRRALGPAELPEGRRFTVTAHAVDELGGRLAWVGEDWDERSPSAVDVSIQLHLAEGGRRVFDWKLPSYNQYFGCDTSHLSFFDDRILVAYREKHAQLAVLVDREEEARGVALDGEPILVFDDLLLCRSASAGLLEAFSLPDFHPRRPLVLDAASETSRYDLELEVDDDGAFRVAGGARLPLRAAGDLALEDDWSRLFEGLWPLIPRVIDDDGLTALLASQLHPFWLRSLSESYLGFPSFRRARSLESLPVYAAREAMEDGRSEEAAALVRQLRAIAEAGEAPGSALVRDGWRHLKNRARALIEDCARGRLAPGRWDFSLKFGGHQSLLPWLPKAASDQAARLAARALSIDGEKA